LSAKRLRDVDSAQRTRLYQAAAWSLAGGAVGALGGWFSGIGAIPGFVVGFAVSFFLSLGLAEGAGKVAGIIHNPSGKSTPAVRQYSYPESLAVRCRFEDAIDAYQVCCADYPDDPEPYVRIGRIYRDELRQYDEALVWLKRARTEATVDRGRELLITQEIIEIYSRKLAQPERAIPELARIVDRFPNDPAADVARREIARLRQETVG
jgi:tetratricopeptide (TPR) repeat protein